MLYDDILDKKSNALEVLSTNKISGNNQDSNIYNDNLDRTNSILLTNIPWTYSATIRPNDFRDNSIWRMG